MKPQFAATVCTRAVVALTFTATLAVPARAARVASSIEGAPVSRVVGLLEKLQKRLEEELAEEEAAWKKYDCWHQKIVDTKTASNTAAQSRIDSLTTYVQDIEAGKFEFTTERIDLEKQADELRKDLSTAADLRAEQGKDFEAAKVEMEQALAALRDAIAALEAAAPSALFARRAASSGLLGIRQNLRKVLTLGQAVLSKADLKILERELTGDVPTWDWKKLNRRATFKMKYNSQTQEIVGVLKKLEGTFAKNLAEAESVEAAAQASYLQLKASKESVLTSTEADLAALVQEHGARALTKTQAQEEITALQAQVVADTGFIGEVGRDHATKATEWAERKRLRGEELVAISQAIAVLHSDDARDVFKKSFQSQTKQSVFFLQENRGSVKSTSRQHLAGSRVLFQLLSKTGDARLLGLLGRNTSSIAQVITMVDQLVTSLEEEETADLQKKELCESNRSDITRQAKLHSQAIDSLSEEIVRQQAKVKEMLGQIDEQEKAMVDINASLLEISRQREDEAAQYASDKADDAAALALLEQALSIIETMTARLQNSTSFAQVQSPSALIARRREQQPTEVEAGQAPPPPPSTWEEPTYKGAAGETDGILGILNLLKEDIKRDIATADSTEAAAIQEFQLQTSDLNNAMTAAKTAISDYNSVKATAEQEAVTKTSERTTKKTELDSTMLELSAIQRGCDWLLVNFLTRMKNRQVELDGLKRAKAILQGVVPA